MTYASGKEIQGFKFEVVSDSCVTNKPFVMVPVDAAELLDSKALGDCIKELIDEAWLAKAINVADWFVFYKNGLPKYILEENQAEIELVERFNGRDEKIDRAVALIRDAKERATHRRAAPKKRQEIQKGYDRYFTAIGRRDGFYCAHCKLAVNDLQIDHVMPVSRGGGNDLQNLQLLCAACNSIKRDKV